MYRRFPKSTRNYREVTIKTLLESPGFTADQATILENIDELTFGQEHGTAIEMIREYLDIKFNILKILKICFDNADIFLLKK